MGVDLMKRYRCKFWQSAPYFLPDEDAYDTVILVKQSQDWQLEF
jgi:hypothetical protein